MARVQTELARSVSLQGQYVARAMYFIHTDNAKSHHTSIWVIK